MDPIIAIILVVAALVVGTALGWFLGNRGVAAAHAERDAREADYKGAISDLALASDRATRVDSLSRDNETLREERDAARLEVATLKADERAFEARLNEFKAAKDVMAAQFADVAGKLLGDAQQSFLNRASERFHQAGESNDARIKTLLGPVEQTLKRYEARIDSVEKERTEAYGQLKGLMDSMRTGQETVRAEAAKLVNALRAAPKARGRWGEQQLRNVLETCGLAEHTDFMMEVSVDADGGRLRPDAIVRVPGNSILVIDAKVSLNAYQDAYGAVDDVERAGHLAQHVASMKAHVNALGNKAYQGQFENTPEFVIMFVPGEHFLSAALEHEPQLWDYAFDRRVLIATPTNLIAIARTVSAVWRQEKLAGEAREIAALGRELHTRIHTMGSHIARLGKNLETATGAYNAFVGSIESQVMTQAKRFETLNIDTGSKSVEPLPMVEASPRPLSKLRDENGEPRSLPEAAE